MRALRELLGVILTALLAFVAMVLTPLVWLAMVAAGVLMLTFLVPAGFAAIAAIVHHGAARAHDFKMIGGLLADAAVVFVAVAVASYYAGKLGEWLVRSRPAPIGRVQGVRVLYADPDADFADPIPARINRLPL